MSGFSSCCQILCVVAVNKLPTVVLRSRTQVYVWLWKHETMVNVSLQAMSTCSCVSRKPHIFYLFSPVIHEKLQFSVTKNNLFSKLCPKSYFRKLLFPGVVFTSVQKTADKQKTAENARSLLYLLLLTDVENFYRSFRARILRQKVEISDKRSRNFEMKSQYYVWEKNGEKKSQLR